MAAASLCPLAARRGDAQDARGYAAYPPQVLARLGGRTPFTPADPGLLCDFELIHLRNSGGGGAYAAVLRATIEPLGEKRLLLDTAGRGLQLKRSSAPGGDPVRTPGWDTERPEIHTGIFAVFTRLKCRELVLEPAVAEIFDGRGFRWVDGILATSLLDAWVVRLDFPRKRLSLVPRASYAPAAGEWPAKLDRNWWVADVSVGRRTARLLLDTGSPRTLLSERWLQGEAGGRGEAARGRQRGAGGEFEAGARELACGGTRRTVACAGIPEERSPALGRERLDGILGFDFLQFAACDLDYRARKIRPLSR